MANAAWSSVQKEKNEIIKTWKGKFFSSTWVLEWFFYFVFEKTSYSLPIWLVTIALFVPVVKRSNSRSQVFYKIHVLKNLEIFTRKHLCWSFFLINFIKNRLQNRCFPVNIAKCLSTAFYIEHLPFITLFRDFMW